MMVDNDKPAKFYLPNSSREIAFFSKNVIIDKVTMQNSVGDDGKTHFSYTVHWKRKNNNECDAIFPKNYHLYLQFDNIPTNENMESNGHTSISSTKSISTPISTFSLLSSDSYAKYEEELKHEYKTGQNIISKSISLSSSTNQLVDKPAMNELQVHVSLIEMVNNELSTIEICNNLYNSMLLRQAIDVFSNEYKVLMNLKKSKHLYVGWGKRSEGQMCNYVLVDENLLNKTLQSIDNVDSGIINLINLVSIVDLTQMH